MKPNLTHDGDNDYTFDLNHDVKSFWVSIGAITLYVQAYDDKVQVELCTQGYEDNPNYSLGSCVATQEEAQDNLS